MNMFNRFTKVKTALVFSALLSSSSAMAEGSFEGLYFGVEGGATFYNISSDSITANELFFHKYDPKSEGAKGNGDAITANFTAFGPVFNTTANSALRTPFIESVAKNGSAAVQKSVLDTTVAFLAANDKYYTSTPANGTVLRAELIKGIGPISSTNKPETISSDDLLNSNYDVVAKDTKDEKLVKDYVENYRAIFGSANIKTVVLADLKKLTAAFDAIKNKNVTIVVNDNTSSTSTPTSKTSLDLTGKDEKALLKALFATGTLPTDLSTMTDKDLGTKIAAALATLPADAATLALQKELFKALGGSATAPITGYTDVAAYEAKKDPVSNEGAKNVKYTRDSYSFIKVAVDAGYLFTISDSAAGFVQGRVGGGMESISYKVTDATKLAAGPNLEAAKAAGYTETDKFETDISLLVGISAGAKVALGDSPVCIVGQGFIDGIYASYPEYETTLGDRKMKNKIKSTMTFSGGAKAGFVFEASESLSIGLKGIVEYSPETKLTFETTDTNTTKIDLNTDIKVESAWKAGAELSVQVSF